MMLDFLAPPPDCVCIILYTIVCVVGSRYL